jgi:hypothetical protein
METQASSVAEAVPTLGGAPAKVNKPLPIKLIAGVIGGVVALVVLVLVAKIVMGQVRSPQGATPAVTKKSISRGGVYGSQMKY